MLIIALIAGLFASFFWAMGAILVYEPARRLGAFTLTRIQLIGASFALCLVATISGGWQSIVVTDWLALAIAGLIGVVGTNLAGMTAMRHGGPVITQLLQALSAPFAAALGFVWLNESLGQQSLVGSFVILSGIVLAIVSRSHHRLQKPSALVIGAGITMALCHAIGLIVLKPVMLRGADPFAVNAVRLLIGTAIVLMLGLLPLKSVKSLEKPDPPLVMQALIPGFLGYVAAATLLIFALRNGPVGPVVLVASLSPVLILPLLWLMKGEKPAKAGIAASLLVVTGLGLIALR